MRFESLRAAASRAAPALLGAALAAAPAGATGLNRNLPNGGLPAPDAGAAVMSAVAPHRPAAFGDGALLSASDSRGALPTTAALRAIAGPEAPSPARAQGGPAAATGDTALLSLLRAYAEPGDDAAGPSADLQGAFLIGSMSAALLRAMAPAGDR